MHKKSGKDHSTARVAAAFVIALVFAVSAVAVPVAVSAERLPVVVVDAGHGGADGGVTGVNSGAKESDLNLAMSRLIGECLESLGFKAVYTPMRTTTKRARIWLCGARSSAAPRPSR